MKKKIVLIAVILLAVLSLGYFWNKHAYAAEQSWFSSSGRPEAGLQIGIIGDSWVVRQNLDSLLKLRLLDHHIHADIISAGNPGAKTKRIYENLFKDPTDEFSSKKIIEKRPDYCIVLAGVNDAATHLGPDYYTHHMLMITKTLLHYGIKPVIIPMPEFGVEEDFKTKNELSRLSNRGAELVLNGGNAFKLEDYRKDLLEQLHKTGLDEKVVVLNFDSVSPDFDRDRDLYADPLHLNTKGYEKLSRFLAESITKLPSP